MSCLSNQSEEKERERKNKLIRMIKNSHFIITKKNWRTIICYKKGNLISLSLSQYIMYVLRNF